jgi:hypothetical protein
MEFAPIGLIVIFALRLLVPLTIFKWPLAGAIASLIVDALDTNIVKPFNVEIPNYVNTDKYLDMYYLTIEAYVSLSWKNTFAKRTSIFLYIWRLIGVVAFEISGIRYLLFIFPNLFENFFIYFLAIKKFHKEHWANSWGKILLSLFILWLLKIPQELVLHVYKVGTPVESLWQWLTNFFK